MEALDDIKLPQKGLRHIGATDLFISSCLPFLERTSRTLTLNWYQKSHFFPTVFDLVLSVINYNFATEILQFSMCLWRFLRVVSRLLLCVHRKKKSRGIWGKRVGECKKRIRHVSKRNSELKLARNPSHWRPEKIQGLN